MHAGSAVGRLESQQKLSSTDMVPSSPGHNPAQAWANLTITASGPCIRHLLIRLTSTVAPTNLAQWPLKPRLLRLHTSPQPASCNRPQGSGAISAAIRVRGALGRHLHVLWLFVLHLNIVVLGMKQRWRLIWCSGGKLSSTAQRWTAQTCRCHLLRASNFGRHFGRQSKAHLWHAFTQRASHMQADDPSALTFPVLFPPEVYTPPAPQQPPSAAAQPQPQAPPPPAGGLISSSVTGDARVDEVGLFPQAQGPAWQASHALIAPHASHVDVASRPKHVARIPPIPPIVHMPQTTHAVLGSAAAAPCGLSVITI